MQRLAERAGEDGARYGDLRRALLAQIRACFWDAECQAFVDSFTSGRRHVTRQGNVFAILFDLVDRQTQELLCRSVLENPEIPPITTPYFQFFELEALCRLGRLARVMQTIHSYWGGMLSCGATTFWEEYDPAKRAELASRIDQIVLSDNSICNMFHLNMFMAMKDGVEGLTQSPVDYYHITYQTCVK